MKLRNKKTGQIGNFTINVDHFECINLDCVPEYESLTELNEEWEDYEEPTTYYYISDFGAIREGDVGKFVEDEIARKEIGNYFETEEEAEKAVEKLKALKRLKDKGFRFRGWNKRYCDEINYQLNTAEDMSKDLDLLFGGEE